jgi:predicted fused transcriptional regulator/phosphomethylpyrimidine kinase/predicted transcriptional regulator
VIEMRFPCEFISSTFLPGLRIRIAHQLRRKGKSQNEISQLLGVKQPVVVSYLQKKIIDTGNEKINHYLDTLSDDVSEMIVAKEELDFVMKTICTKCKSLRVNGPLCAIHKSILPSLVTYKNCDICFGFNGLPSIEGRAEILRSLVESLDILKQNEKFYEWIPEIGSQLVACDENASDLDDIASFPGRIIKVKGEVVNVSPPEFGSSRTMSSLLLWIRNHQSSVKWIISIKNKSNLPRKLMKLKIPFEEITDLESNWEESLALLSQRKSINKTKAILDMGSLGYESIGYIFGNSAGDLLERINLIAD